MKWGMTSLDDIASSIETTNDRLDTLCDLLTQIRDLLAAQRDTQPLGVSDEGAAWAMEASE